MKKLIIMILCLSFILLTACTTSSTMNRGSLSDAMDKSRDDYEEEREVPDEEIPQAEEEDEYEEDDEEYEEADSYASSQNQTPSSIQLLIRGGDSFLGGPYFLGSGNGEILVGSTFDHWAVYLSAGFNILRVNQNHQVSESIKDNPLALNAALEGRYYFFKELKVFSPYLLARIGGFIMFWEFENPLTAGDETIESDSLGGMILGSGLGIDFYRGDSFNIGAVVMPEWYIFGDQTSQGFTNDFFSSQGVTRWAVEAGYRF
jgi:hypothetical protein